MSVEITDDALAKAADDALKLFAKPDRDIWAELGGSVDDARQEALMGAWKIGQKERKTASLGSWLYRGAKSSLLNYYGKLRADHDKRSPARLVKCGLDDLPVEWKFPEMEYDGVVTDDEGNEQKAVPEAEVQGADVAEKELLAKLKLILAGDIVGSLEDRERWVLCDEYRIPTTLRGPRRLKRGERKSLLGSAMRKIRAEMRADEIVNL